MEQPARCQGRQLRHVARLGPSVRIVIHLFTSDAGVPVEQPAQRRGGQRRQVAGGALHAKGKGALLHFPHQRPTPLSKFATLQGTYGAQKGGLKCLVSISTLQVEPVIAEQGFYYHIYLEPPYYFSVGSLQPVSLTFRTYDIACSMCCVVR